MAIKGIGMENKALPQSSRTLLLNHKSPTLEDIMRSCMMRSDNLYAEALLRSVAVKRGMEGSTSKAIKSERDFWRKRGLDLSDIEIHDGSGLSRSNRITASFLANVLYYMSSDAEYASYFPLAGAEGTLKKFLADTELECYIALKTGSMNGIQCYAGYKVDEDFAPTYAVVIIGNNIGNRSNFRSHTQKMLLEAFTDNTPTE